MIPIKEQWYGVPDEVYDSLESDGFVYSGSSAKWQGDYELYCKVVDGKGIWKAVPADAKSVDDILSIPYRAALGYEPIKDNSLGREVGKKILPKITESTNRSDISINFSKDEYEKLKQVVAEGTDDEDYWDFYGTIELGTDPDTDLFAIDIVARYPYDELEACYDIYRVYSKDLYDDIDNDNFESGKLDLSLSYEDQLEFLISTLEAASERYSKGSFNPFD